VHSKGDDSPGSPPRGKDGLPLFKSILVENVGPLLWQMVEGPLGQWYSEQDASSEKFKRLFPNKEKKSSLAIRDVTSHVLRAYLLDGKKHPAKVCPGLFSKELPQVVLTYEWKQGLSEVEKILTDSNVKNHPKLLQDPNILRGKNSDANPTSWVDILFIDQLAKNIPVELGVAQEYYIRCILHIVAGSDTLLRRGWCLWELGLRAHAQKDSLVVGSLENLGADYDFYGNMELFDPGDRTEIEFGLKRVFDFSIERINRAIANQVYTLPRDHDLAQQVGVFASSRPVGSVQEGFGFAPVDIPHSGLATSPYDRPGVALYRGPGPAPFCSPSGRVVAYPHGGSALHRPGEFSAQQAGYSGPPPPPAQTNTGSAGGSGGGGYGNGGGSNARMVALGQDAGGLPGESGLTHADFRTGEPVAVLRTSGRHTVGRVAASWPGWVRVEVEQGGASKDVPEGQVYRLLGGLRLA